MVHFKQHLPPAFRSAPGFPGAHGASYHHVFTPGRRGGQFSQRGKLQSPADWLIQNVMEGSPFTYTWKFSVFHQILHHV